jgi:hypothetical protein
LSQYERREFKTSLQTIPPDRVTRYEKQQSDRKEERIGKKTERSEGYERAAVCPVIRFSAFSFLPPAPLRSIELWRALFPAESCVCFNNYMLKVWRKPLEAAALISERLFLLFDTSYQHTVQMRNKAVQLRHEV